MREPLPIRPSDDPGFGILYEEGACIVVAKPSGVLTQAPPWIDSMELRIKNFLAQREGYEEDVYLGMPHRLDRPASGVLVVATKRKAARRLSEQFEGRLLRKVYWAYVSGYPGPEGEWKDHVRKVPDEARAEVVPEDHPEGRYAALRYKTIFTSDVGSLLEIELETGRTHQIRLQAGSRGFPILGDGQYGSTVAFGPDHEDERVRQIALHSRSLTFAHPKSYQIVSVTAPLPRTWGNWPLPPTVEKEVGK